MKYNALPLTCMKIVQNVTQLLICYLLIEFCFNEQKMSQKTSYQLLNFIPAASNIVERLFIGAKSVNTKETAFPLLCLKKF